MAFVPVGDDAASVPLHVVCRDREDRPEVLATEAAIIRGTPTLLGSLA